MTGSLTKLRLNDVPAGPAPVYLGSAVVAAPTTGDRVSVTVGRGEPRDARLALAFPYEPVKGDLLLVIGDPDHAGPDGLYVIGVLKGQGTTSFAFPGDVSVHARDGKLSLSGDRGVDFRGPRLDFVTEHLSSVATHAVQKFGHLHQRVREMLSVHAGESHTIVEGASHTQAKKVALVAEETVSVNGRQILLG